MQRTLPALVLAAALMVGPPAVRAADSDQQQVVDGATAAVTQMKAASGFVRSGVLARAKAALIVPNALRAALGVGVEGGRAVLVENKAGRWTDPAFYTVGGVSVGLQVGGDATTSVLLIMTDRALKTLLKQSNATGGVHATVTVARYDVNRIAQIGGADVVIWSTSEGAFTGANIDLTGFVQDNSSNAAYYGSAMDASAIFQRALSDPGDAKLRRAL